VITLPRNAELDAARAQLEDKLELEYERQVARLAELLDATGRRRARSGRLETEAEATRSVRSAIADAAQALRRMAEGSYGRCELCTDDIALDVLQARPAIRFCRTCQSASEAASARSA
jgi:DnaK suppressor protein